MIGTIFEFGSYALLLPATIAGYRFRGRFIPKTPKELPISGNRNDVGPRKYECMCMHLPTTHERIVAQSDQGATFIRFGKCKNDGCKCMGYLGPLPVGETTVMIIDDMGLEWTAVDAVKKKLTEKSSEVDELKKEVNRLNNTNKSLQAERSELGERLRERNRELGQLQSQQAAVEHLKSQQPALEPPKK